jgi:UDP:flavonoid glycosyltransferase YjiC (YdhE family)
MFFYEVALQLEKSGYKVFWLSPSKRWANWLYSKGVPRNRILDITEYWKERNGGNKSLTTNELQSLFSLEEYSGIRINDVILMDRLLSKKHIEYALLYLSTCNKHITNFISTNNIKVVFSEATWAFELITIMICKKLKLNCYCPHTIRIPDGRFAFFEGHNQAKFEQIRKVTEEDIKLAESYYDMFLTKKPKPKYWYINNKIPKFRLDWINKMISHIIMKVKGINHFDETYFGMRYLIQKRIQEVCNAKLISILNPFEKPPRERPYVLFTLHKQPEASIDVLGSMYSNQLETIKKIIRRLPVTHELYVKEHSNSIGDRSLNFYNNIKSLPNVKLIDPYVDSHELIKGADLVITISGTIAYEAALYGVPAITLADMFFKPILANNNVDLSSINIQEIRENLKSFRREKIIEFLAYMYANSFEGEVSDPKTSPSCVSNENIAKVTRGFHKVLSNQLS